MASGATRAGISKKEEVIRKKCGWLSSL